MHGRVVWVKDGRSQSALVGLVLGMAPALGVNPYRERVKTHSTFSVPDGGIRALISRWGGARHAAGGVGV